MLPVVHSIDESRDRRFAIVIEWRHQAGGVLEERLAVIVGVKRAGTGGAWSDV